GWPGKNGKEGKDWKDGIKWKDGTNGKDGTDGVDGRDGDPGPGMELGLTRIEALSWTHNQSHTAGEPRNPDSFFADVDMGGPGGQIIEPGLVIVFTHRGRFGESDDE